MYYVFRVDFVCIVNTLQLCLLCPKVFSDSEISLVLGFILLLTAFLSYIFSTKTKLLTGNLN